MNCSTPGLPVHHHLLEFTQTHVHRVSDAIQPSHPLSSPSPPAPNPSQHQSFPMSQHFAWGGQSTGVSALTSFVPKKPQGWSPSELLVGSPCSPRDSQESSPTAQIKGINSLALSFIVISAQLLQSCPTLCDPMDYSPPGFSVCGILQARILEWAAIPFSRGSSQPRDWTHVSCGSCIVGESFNTEVLGKLLL